MKLASFLFAAAIVPAATVAQATTVHSAASYQLLNFSPSAGLTFEWSEPEPFEERAQDGTGSASTAFHAHSVTADAATAGHSGVAMDYGTAKVIGRERMMLSNTGPWLGTFGGRILPALMVSIDGNNDGQALPEGLFGALANASAAINIFLTVFRTDGTEAQSTLYNAALDLGFGEIGTQQGTGGGINGIAFASSLNPGESAELMFEISALANAWHADPLVAPEPSPVPLPGSIALLPGALALLLGARSRSAGKAPNRH